MITGTTPQQKSNAKAIEIRAVKDLLIDFGLPFLIIVICFTLMMFNHDGEIKSIFTLTVGWIVKSGISRAGQNKNGG